MPPPMHPHMLYNHPSMQLFNQQHMMGPHGYGPHQGPYANDDDDQEPQSEDDGNEYQSEDASGENENNLKDEQSSVGEGNEQHEQHHRQKKATKRADIVNESEQTLKGAGCAGQSIERGHEEYEKEDDKAFKNMVMDLQTQ